MEHCIADIRYCEKLFDSFYDIGSTENGDVYKRQAHIYPIGGLLYFVFFMLIGLHVFWSLGRGHFYKINYSGKKEKERQEQLAAKRQMRRLAEEYRLFEPMSFS